MRPLVACDLVTPNVVGLVAVDVAAEHVHDASVGVVTAGVRVSGRAAGHHGLRNLHLLSFIFRIRHRLCRALLRLQALRAPLPLLNIQNEEVTIGPGRVFTEEAAVAVDFAVFDELGVMADGWRNGATLIELCPIGIHIGMSALTSLLDHRLQIELPGGVVAAFLEVLPALYDQAPIVHATNVIASTLRQFAIALEFIPPSEEPRIPALMLQSGRLLGILV